MLFQIYETIIYCTREVETRGQLQVQGQPSERQRVPGQPVLHSEIGSKTKQKTSITQEKSTQGFQEKSKLIFKACKTYLPILLTITVIMSNLPLKC